MTIAGTFFGQLFDTADFTPRWSCGNWPAGLGWLHILSDIAIFGAYMAIPASLAFFIRRRKDLPLKPVFWLFVGFILLCGLTHMVEAILFYQPVYRFSGGMKAATALISWATVVAMLRLLPEAFALPGIRVANERLTAEVARLAAVEGELEAARTDLERRTGQLALREHRMRSALDSAAVGAVRWEIDSGVVLWEMGVREALRRCDIDVADFHDWAALLPPGDALALKLAASEAAVSGRTMYTALHLQFARRLQPVALAGRVDPHVAGQPRTMTGMLRLIID